MRRYLATHPAPAPRAARRWRDVSAPTVRERTSKFAGKRSVVREQLRAWRLFRSVKRPVISDIRMLHARNRVSGDVSYSVSPLLSGLGWWVTLTLKPWPGVGMLKLTSAAFWLEMNLVCLCVAAPEHTARDLGTTLRLELRTIHEFSQSRRWPLLR